MALSSYLIDKFAKATVNKQKTKKESTVYGMIQIQNGVPYVKIDGSEVLTPVTTTTNIYDGDRVMVQLKDHNAIILGNLSSPAVGETTINEIRIDQEQMRRIENENAEIKKTLESQKTTITELTTNVTKLSNDLKSLQDRVSALEKNV